eukprot:COSAG04_NODE_767_length_10483_cov_27.449398_3_plen_89_part_00
MSPLHDAHVGLRFSMQVLIPCPVPFLLHLLHFGLCLDVRRIRDRPYVFQPLTFLSPPLNTEIKIHLFTKKLKNRDFGDFPFFPMFSSP